MIEKNVCLESQAELGDGMHSIRRIVLLLLLIFGGTTSASASSAENCYLDLLKSSRELKEADNQLNEVYNRAISTLDAHLKLQLKHAQREWLKQRNLMIDTARMNKSNPEPGLRELINARIRELEEIAARTARPKYLGPMRFSVYWPCAGNAYGCAPRILAEGTIEDDSQRRFIAFLDQKDKHQHTLPPKPTVCFDSPGGSLKGAITLGQAIRDRGFNTCLGEEYASVPLNFKSLIEEVFLKDVRCASACVFALAGGVNRYVSDSARIGVHQFVGNQAQVGDSLAQFTVVALAGYLEDMGINRALVDISSVVPNESIYWLTSKEIKAFRIENVSVTLAEWHLDTTVDGSIFAIVSQEVPENHCTVTLVIKKSIRGAVLLILSEPPNPGGEGTDLVLQAVDNKAMTLYVDGKEIITYGSASWRRINKKVVATELALNPETVHALKTGKQLDLLVHTPHFLEVYDPSTEFQLRGLGRLLTGVLK